MTLNTAKNYSPSANLAIATTILSQLGGNRFLAMTGARNLITVENGLSFSLPRQREFVKDGISRVTVKLTAEDLYDVEYGKMVGLKYVPVRKDEGLFCDQLQAFFTRATGLDTHL